MHVCVRVCMPLLLEVIMLRGHVKEGCGTTATLGHLTQQSAHCRK